MSKSGSNSLSGALGLQEENLVQEAPAEGKKTDPEKVVFIIKDSNVRIVWLERGDAFGEF